jgi:hypothetical protein
MMDRDGALESKATTGWLVAIILLLLLAAGMRVNNAFAHRLDYGFDANWNWEYIERLTGSWELPAPHDGWSMGHPPLFYYSSAAVARAMHGASKREVVIVIRLISSAIGLLAIGAAVLLIARRPPPRPERTFLAAGLLLFLPVHVYVSAMLGEEILAASLASFAVVGVVLQLGASQPLRRALWSSAGLGLVAGLAFVTKLSGLLVIAAVVGTWAVHGLRRRQLGHAVACAGVFAGVAGVVGGWPYARNWLEFGYLYPHQLEVHDLMKTMPPGERGLGDYLRVPAATFTDPQVLNRDLVRSVWGTTYISIWHDGHRVVLPRSAPSVTLSGSAMLLLALIPSAAFGVGLLRGARRALASPGGPDTLFLLLVALTLAGYVAFTWRDPYYAVVKGSYLLGILVPFAWYTSEVLADWTRGRGLRPKLVAGALLALLALCVATFTFGLVFTKTEGPGFKWKKLYPPPMGSSMLREVPKPSVGAHGVKADQVVQGPVEQVQPYDALGAREAGGARPTLLAGPLGHALEETELLVEAQAALRLGCGGPLRMAAIGVGHPA